MPTNTIGTTVSAVVECAEVPKLYPGITERWLVKARVIGGGPRFIKVGKKVLYRVADIEKWLDEQTRVSTSDKGPPRKKRGRAVKAEARETVEAAE